MPSTATITAYYSFTANTKARAAQVTSNFDVWRGHHISVDPNTVTSTDITYDIGSDEHRWRNGYFKTIDLDRSTTTASATIEADANTNTGEMVFKLNGTERVRFNANGIKPTSIPLFATMTGDVIFTTDFTNTEYLIAGSTLSVSGLSRPPMLYLRDIGGSSGSLLFSPNTTTGLQLKFRIYRGTTQIFESLISQLVSSNIEAIQIPSSSLWTIDIGFTTGATSYEIRTITATKGPQLSGNIRLALFQL